ncbi:hypothetical protein GE09DRAFT_1218801 [Coniochaeta sp. 2T2.1]|nr:hypothetical protein GE09DRAFT_1218801 [Coniochaeta sp. 2T2.1]
MKLTAALNFLLAASPALASRFPKRESPVFRRDTGTCNVQLATSNGGRKVAIVIDSSGSMSGTDPNNLRITAGKALNNQLVPAAGATGGKQADLVTVVDFDDVATVIYPLGDPAGAGSSFDQIDSSGGTFIADGIEKAVAQLSAPGNDPTADRSGIVVLTDGEDSDVVSLTNSIVAAGSAGIRVSFGFLASSTASYDPDLLAAILRTGGTYVSFETADAIQSFLYLLLSNGLTKTDTAASGDQALLPGVTVAKLTAGSAGVGFSYAAVAGETVSFTVESLSAQALDAELTDGSGASVGKNSTGSSGEAAVLEYTAAASTNLKLVVSSSNSTAEGVFQVSVLSSLGISACNLTTVPNNTTGGTGPTGTGSVVVTPTPTKTSPPFVTAGAGKVVTFGVGAFGVVLAGLLL